jgi:hypothetical protein
MDYQHLIVASRVAGLLWQIYLLCLKVVSHSLGSGK